MFGSVLDDRFRSHSDLDLLVEGLPPAALLDAIALAEAGRRHHKLSGLAQV